MLENIKVKINIQKYIIILLLLFLIVIPMSFGVPTQPKIISRNKWKANNPICTLEKQPYFNMITIHHTATSNTQSDSENIVRSIQKYHQKERKWCDIGYHFLIDKNGKIYEGRPLWAIGAHVAKHNIGNIGIALIGNYEETMPSNKSIEALTDLVAWLAYNYNIPIGNIKGHKDFSNTLCPGKHLYSLLPKIKRKVASTVYGFGNGFGKAVWWGIYSDYWSSNKSVWEKQIREAFNVLKELGIDTVFFMVKDPWGYAYYNSSILPLSNKYDWDPLKYIIKYCREYNISIHVYINVLAEGDSEPNDYLKSNLDIALRDQNDKILGWVDPSSEKHLKRIISIIREILEKYNVDGIQLDRIRLPGNAHILPITEKEFREEYGLAPSQDWKKWIDFKADKLTTFVKKIREAIKEFNPDIRFSAAVIPNSLRAKTVLAQDWQKWLRKGILDFVAIMSYSSSEIGFENYLNDAVEASNGTRPVYLGIGVFMSDMDSDMLKKEIIKSFENVDIYGVVFFNVDTLLKDKVKRAVIKETLSKLNYDIELSEGKNNTLLYFVGGGILLLVLTLLFLLKITVFRKKEK